MKEFTIGPNDAGQRLDRWLAKTLPLLPAPLAQKYIRLKRVKVNGKGSKRDVRLQKGDVLQLYINDEFFHQPTPENAFLSVFKPQLDILYEDEHIMLLNKRPGMVVHPDEKERVNTLITHIRKLTGDRRYRRAQEQVVCEGPKMLEEALRWGAKLEVVLWDRDHPLSERVPPEVRQVRVPEDVLKSIAPTQTPQGVLFLCTMPDSALPPELEGRKYLVLDGLQDPGNVGTLWRTADAFGADGLLLLPGCADPWNPKTVRATMGACFRLPLWETELEPLAQRLEAAALPLYAAALGPDTADLRQADLRRAAVVIGSEGQGVSEAVLAQCQGRLKIPMRERCESLNAAAAGAVVLWEMGQREG